MDKARYSDMRFCALQVGSELKAFENLADTQGISASIVKPVKTRLAYMPLRAYFMRKIVAYLQACPDFDRSYLYQYDSSDDLFNKKLPFLFEVIITIQYLHNQILDGKCGVVAGEQINDNLLIANQLKDLLYDYIAESFQAEASIHITRTVRRIFQYVDQGQRIEKKWGTYDAFQSSQLSRSLVLPEKLEEFIELEDSAFFLDKILNDFSSEKHLFVQTYFKRIYLTCAALFKLGVQLILDLTNYRGQEASNLLRFAGSYGMMRQIVNDNADYIPSYFQLSTKGKVPGDAFSDLKNKNLTLPLLYFLSSTKDSTVHQFLNGQHSFKDTMQEQVFEEMLGSFALLKSIQNAKLLALLAKQYLQPSNPGYAFIADSCKIAEWNKFIYPCYRSTSYKHYRKTGYYKNTKNLIQSIQQELNIQYEEPASGGQAQMGASRKRGNY